MKVNPYRELDDDYVPEFDSSKEEKLISKYDPDAIIETLEKAKIPLLEIEVRAIRANEDIYNPSIEVLLRDSADSCLEIGERKIFVLGSDGYVRVGSKNYKSTDPYESIQFIKYFEPEQWAFLNQEYSNGHPTLLIKDHHFDGRAYCGGWIVKRKDENGEFIQVIFHSGRLRTAFRGEKFIIISKILEDIFSQSYKCSRIVIYEDFEKYKEIFFKRSIDEKKNEFRIFKQYVNSFPSSLFLDVLQKAAEKHAFHIKKEVKFSIFHKHGEDGIIKNESLIEQIKANSFDFLKVLELFKSYLNDELFITKNGVQQKLKGHVRCHSHSFISFFLNEFVKTPRLVWMICKITGNESLLLQLDSVDYTKSAAKKNREALFNYFKTLVIPRIITDKVGTDIILHKFK